MESRYNPNAVSRAGAMGLMQLMPRTARELGVNPRVPTENVKGGIVYLSDMVARFNCIELALAGYNAGPGAVRAAQGVPPYAETRAYIEKIRKEEK